MHEDNEKNGFDDFTERFASLADEAHKYGIFACVILEADNPISGTSRLSETLRGGRMRSIGMLQQALWHLQQNG